jgi:hypothetical protein
VGRRSQPSLDSHRTPDAAQQLALSLSVASVNAQPKTKQIRPSPVSSASSNKTKPSGKEIRS